MPPTQDGLAGSPSPPPPPPTPVGTDEPTTSAGLNDESATPPSQAAGPPTAADDTKSSGDSASGPSQPDSDSPSMVPASRKLDPLKIQKRGVPGGTVGPSSADAEEPSADSTAEAPKDALTEAEGPSKGSDSSEDNEGSTANVDETFKNASADVPEKDQKTPGSDNDGAPGGYGAISGTSRDIGAYASSRGVDVPSGTYGAYGAVDRGIVGYGDPVAAPQGLPGETPVEPGYGAPVAAPRALPVEPSVEPVDVAPPPVQEEVLIPDVDPKAEWAPYTRAVPCEGASVRTHGKCAGLAGRDRIAVRAPCKNPKDLCMVKNPFHAQCVMQERYRLKLEEGWDGEVLACPKRDT